MPILQPQQDYAFIGSSFVRSYGANPPSDCVGLPDPSASLLKCLDFALPPTFTAPSGLTSIEDRNITSPFASEFTFSSTDPGCGSDTDFTSRLTAVYGPINTNSFKVLGSFNTSDPDSPSNPHLIYKVQATFLLQSNATCDISWFSTAVQSPGSYVLDYKSPVCGSNGPRLVDKSEANREKFAFATVQVDRYAPILIQGQRYQNFFSPQYRIESSGILYNMLSNYKFTITVTFDELKTTVNNSCVYTYVAEERAVVTRTFTLQSYDLGTLSLVGGADVNDGCINTIASTDVGSLLFTNASDACGNTDPVPRFKRYFGNDKNVVYNLLDAATGVFNISVGNPSSNVDRRDAGDATFHFFDNSVIPTTTTSTTSSTTFTTTTSSSTSTTSSTSSSSSSTSFSTSSSTLSSTSSSSTFTTKTTATTSTLTTTASAFSPSSSVSVAEQTTANPKTFATQTGYVAPAGYTPPTGYGIPSGNNNIYKGSAKNLQGFITAMIAAFIFTL